jgi:hypothetical protein
MVDFTSIIVTEGMSLALLSKSPTTFTIFSLFFPVFDVKKVIG